MFAKRLLRSFYALTITLSAFLLFQIQPLISKYLLPWFGSTPVVWSTAMLFFQLLLLGGNAYAFWLVGRLRPRSQGQAHILLLGSSLILLAVAALPWDAPILPGPAWRPANPAAPTGQLLRTLAVAVGVPFLILCTNNPLMQSWFSAEAADRSPYRLYALSNIGSLLGLVTYPLLVEPNLALVDQARLWTLGYVLFAVFTGYAAFRRLRASPRDAPEGGSVADRPQHGLFCAGIGVQSRPPEPGIRSSPNSLRMGLAACASTILLAITNQITQELSVTPLLWVAPLAVYLLTFILCFSNRRWYQRAGYAIALLPVSALCCVAFYYRPVTWPVSLQVGVYLLTLFVCCMICHGELAAGKPPPQRLTAFYLWIAAGGALGGVFVGLIAPALFRNFWELPLGLLACWLLLAGISIRTGRSRPASGTTRPPDLVLVTGIALIATSLLLYVNWNAQGALYTHRSFYGVLRVSQGETGGRAGTYKLFHGSTLHGFQYTDAARRGLPTAYYTEESGVGLAIRHHPRRAAGLRIGAIGLGVGTLAAYGEPADLFRFYEINPDVIDLAEGAGGYFSYLADCRAPVEIVPGDARISLERELAQGAPGEYDLLVVDAFNDDAIPLHLLTQEAFALYLRHLRPAGILALHLSNYHLDLGPVVQQLADRSGLAAALIVNLGDGERVSHSIWMLATRERAFLAQSEIAARTAPRPNYAGLRPWTDDYSNLLQVLR